jgi:hypothetical protein
MKLLGPRFWMQRTFCMVVLLAIVVFPFASQAFAAPNLAASFQSAPNHVSLDPPAIQPICVGLQAIVTGSFGPGAAGTVPLAPLVQPGTVPLAPLVKVGDIAFSAEPGTVSPQMVTSGTDSGYDSMRQIINQREIPLSVRL